MSHQLVQKTLFGIITATVMLCSTTILAIDCNQLSPSFKNKESYYDVSANIKITSKQEKQFSKFIQRISGNWVGEKNYFDCIGSEKKSRKRHQQTEIDAEIRNSTNTTLDIRYEDYSQEHKTTKQLKLTSAGKDRIFQIKFPSKNTLMFSEKYCVGTNLRKQNSNNNSINFLVENFYVIKLKHSKLSIQITSYRNGYFASFEKWKMK